MTDSGNALSRKGFAGVCFFKDFFSMEQQAKNPSFQTGMFGA
jgi:hypothetical protein